MSGERLYAIDHNDRVVPLTDLPLSANAGLTRPSSPILRLYEIASP
jgi:hypothetical protein